MPVKIIRKSSVQPSAKPPRGAAGTTKPFSSITNALGVERMAIVDSMLLNGETGDVVAKTIKLEWKLLPKITLASLATRLTKYRKVVLVSKLVMLTDKSKPRLSDFADKVDVLENLTKLVEIQQGRISKALVAEKGNDEAYPLNRSIRYEFQLLGNLYKQLSDLQMDLGLIRKVPAKLQIEGMATRTQQALEQAMQRDGRVTQALSQAFTILAGKYEVVKNESPNPN